MGLMYAAVAFFVSFWPEMVNVTAVDMNWACLVWGSDMLLCILLHLVRAQHYYEGPIREF